VDDLLSPLASGVLAGLAVAMPLGPIGTLVFERGARLGFRHGAAAGLGVATADGLYALLAAAAGAAIAAALEGVRDALRLVAAVSLLAIVAYGLAAYVRHRGEARAPVEVPAGRTYAVFLGLTAINPLTVSIFAALIAGLPDIASAGAAAKGVFVAGAFAASAAWQLSLAGAGAFVGARLPAHARAWTTLAGYAIVLGLAVHMLLSG
jgi:threonine/homoserine/homoserine lactone efflux protein